jgi:hypothetical protein
MRVPLSWPETFGTRFTIFVDVEEEFDWSAPLSADNRAVTAVSELPKADGRLRDLGAVPAYLVDYPVAVAPGAIEVMRELVARPGGEIGAQLHPWVNPPFTEEASAGHGFVGNLPEANEAAKLQALTAAITAAVGVAPRVYRAGRYGIGPNTFALLAAQGYRLDTSMRARFDYRADGGPSFAGIGNHAFRAGPSGRVVELPLTTAFTGALRRGGPALYPRLASSRIARGLLARTGLLSRVPLTPEGVPVQEALEAVRVALGEGTRVLNFAFHSPSLVPGHTPYVRDAADLGRFYGWWDAMLQLLDRRGVAGTSVADLVSASSLASEGAAPLSRRTRGL